MVYDDVMFKSLHDIVIKIKSPDNKYKVHMELMKSVCEVLAGGVTDGGNGVIHREHHNIFPH